jgi:pimeloyl-ACP methyl ester carboxylesterase
VTDTVPPSLASPDPLVRERPAWFSANLAVPYESRFVDVDGTPVHYQRWGSSAKPGLLFVHGGAANSSWFTFLAPFFTNSCQVAAIDLSGMGDSGSRATYGREQFTTDVLGVLSDSGMFDRVTRPVVVGHSMGGIVLSQLGRQHGDRLLGAVICDVGRMPRDAAAVAAFGGRTMSGPPTVKKYYETREAALARYRLAPPQPCVNQYILDYLAEGSLRETPEGWSWKFDPGVFSMERPGAENPMDLRFDGMRCRAALVYGSRSHFADEATLSGMREETGGHVPIVIVPDAHHHLFIDQPLAFTAAIQAITAMWHTEAGATGSNPSQSDGKIPSSESSDGAK